MLQQNIYYLPRILVLYFQKNWKTTTYHTEIKADSNDFDNANDDDRPIIYYARLSCWQSYKFYFLVRQIKLTCGPRNPKTWMKIRLKNSTVC